MMNITTLVGKFPLTFPPTDKAVEQIHIMSQTLNDLTPRVSPHRCRTKAC